MAVAWIDVGTHWYLQHSTRGTLAALGYGVVARGQGWMDPETGRRAILLDITGDGLVASETRQLSTERWPDRY